MTSAVLNIDYTIAELCMCVTIHTSTTELLMNSKIYLGPVGQPDSKLSDGFKMSKVSN